MMNTLIDTAAVDLNDIGPDDLGSVGDKALNLGRMLRARLPVPPGFCVTTAAYERVVGNRLAEVIAELRQAADDQQVRLAERARELVSTARSATSGPPSSHCPAAALRRPSSTRHPGSAWTEASSTR